MEEQALTNHTSPAAADSPGDRNTQFKAVDGGPTLHSGTLLVVEAYSAIWLILFLFVWVTFRRQRHLDSRLVELERAMNAARKEPQSR